ncbi:hypothetical protein E1A91_A04G048100v1 [Gossypium mustelinum]|uniref:Tryptophan synthase beta chain-like PALP domain-containing protein n=2 Tax=Gossypium TaxID=3633 RepID=A0A5D2ZNL7_GOSMU|nr:hypothetical protein E1A91_A04G048100v1 [Gossypium mustelinum]
MMAKLTNEQLEKGVICSSAGNHAQGVALAARKLGCNAVIAMPVTTPEIKWQSVERLGATVVLVGDSYDEAQAYAKKRAKEESRTFIPPFDHPDVIMGQGTIGMEIVRQMQGPLHAIFVPVGGGGLIAGIAAYVKRVSPEVKAIPGKKRGKLGRFEKGTCLNLKARRRKRKEERRRDWIPKAKKKMRKTKRKGKNQVRVVRVLRSSPSWFVCTLLHQRVVQRKEISSNNTISLLSVMETKD